MKKGTVELLNKLHELFWVLFSAGGFGKSPPILVFAVHRPTSLEITFAGCIQCANQASLGFQLFSGNEAGSKGSYQVRISRASPYCLCRL